MEKAKHNGPRKGEQGCQSYFWDVGGCGGQSTTIGVWHWKLVHRRGGGEDDEAMPSRPARERPTACFFLFFTACARLKTSVKFRSTRQSCRHRHERLLNIAQSEHVPWWLFQTCCPRAGNFCCRILFDMGSTARKEHGPTNAVRSASQLWRLACSRSHWPARPARKRQRCRTREGVPFSRRVLRHLFCAGKIECTNVRKFIVGEAFAHAEEAEHVGVAGDASDLEFEEVCTEEN